MTPGTHSAKSGGKFKRSTSDWIETGAPQGGRLRLAWAAGLFDGEGCICATIVNRKDGAHRNVRLRVSISQNEPTTLDRFRRAVGVASVVHNLGQGERKNHPTYVVQYDGRQAYEVLRRLRPFLFRKAAELNLALRLWVRGRLGQRSGPRGWSPKLWAFRLETARQLSAMKGRRSGGVRG